MACGCDQVIDAAKWAVHGVAGQVKARLRIGLAPPEVTEQRRSICRGCEHAVPCLLKPDLKCRCADCGCPLKEKTALASESCRLGKWAAHDQT